MAKLSTQKRERYYFEMFRKDYDLQRASVVYSDKPDVILEGEKRIGIEITNFFIEAGNHLESERIQRRAREKVVAGSHRLYLDDKGKKTELTFGFDKRHPILDQEKLVRKIFELARRIDGSKTGQIGFEVFKGIPELSFVYFNAKEYHDAKWRVAQVHSVPFMSLKSLRDIIKEKETKSKKYQRCDAYWLLVIVDFIDPAQDQEIRVDGFENVNSAVFENILIYKPHFGHVMETKNIKGLTSST